MGGQPKSKASSWSSAEVGRLWRNPPKPSRENKPRGRRNPRRLRRGGCSTNHFPIAVVGAKAFPIVQAYGARLGMKPHSPHASSLGKGQDLSEHATAESLAPPIDRRVHAHQVRLLS